MRRATVQLRAGETYGADLHVADESTGVVLWWNTSTKAFEAYSVAHLSLYDIGASVDAFGFVAINVPVDVPDSDNLKVYVRLKAGDDFSEAELQVSEAMIEGAWKGGAWLTEGELSADIGTLLTRIPFALFNGITSLAKWLGVAMGNGADPGTLAEINATAAGASYSNASQSLQAIAANSGGGDATAANQQKIIELLET